MSQKARGRGEQGDYQSYLLRLWRVNGGQDDWQASLESTHTGERRGFGDLEAMLAYLKRETAGDKATPDEDGHGGESQAGEGRREQRELE